MLQHQHGARPRPRHTNLRRSHRNARFTVRLHPLRVDLISARLYPGRQPLRHPAGGVGISAPPESSSDESGRGRGFFYAASSTASSTLCGRGRGFFYAGGGPAGHAHAGGGPAASSTRGGTSGTCDLRDCADGKEDNAQARAHRKPIHWLITGCVGVVAFN